MTAASVNGITIEYDVHGDAGGDPLLLVMGLGGQLVSWPLEFVERLVAKGFRVIRFDNRDIGLSSEIPAPPPTRRQLLLSIVSRRFAKSSYLVGDMADDAAGLLDHLGVARAHVVGISMGGMISQTLAIVHPDRVASVTSIMSNTGDRKHGKMRKSLLRTLPRLMVRTPEEAIDKGVEMFRLISGPHFDAEGARALGKEAFDRSYRPDGADTGHPRSRRPAGDAERRHRHGEGDPRREARDVPRHGP
jgi:pimeloyl-ACP methyl ester carboxylesterase